MSIADNLPIKSLEGFCWYCGGGRGMYSSLVFDHFVPRSKGGSNANWNLIPSCNFCNSSKNNKGIEEFRQHKIKQLAVDTFSFWIETHLQRNIALIVTEYRIAEIAEAIDQQKIYLKKIADQYEKRIKQISELDNEMQSLKDGITRGEYDL